MKLVRNDLKVIESVIELGAHSVTKFLESNLVVRATRKLYGPKGKKGILTGNIEVVFTFGKPNFDERKFLKKELKFLKGNKKEIKARMANIPKRIKWIPRWNRK